jgi:hypothetical protein
MTFWDSVIVNTTDKTTGYNMYVAKTTFGHLCGYVEVAPEHCCYKGSYWDAPLKNVKIHGGITFSEFVPSRDVDKPASWLVGFDCGHGCDFSPRLNLGHPENYKDEDWVLEELQLLAKQLYTLDKRSKLRKMPVRLSIRCPECLIPCFFAYGIKEHDLEGSTTTCSNCGELLIIKDQHAVSFHPWLNAEDNRWPEDGKDTGKIDLPDNS